MDKTNYAGEVMKIALDYRMPNTYYKTKGGRVIHNRFIGWFLTSFWECEYDLGAEGKLPCSGFSASEWSRFKHRPLAYIKYWLTRRLSDE